MKKIIILGRGGSGKSTLAKQLSQITGIPHIELDKYFWKPGLVATPTGEWRQIQKKLINQSSWIIDGDLGKYDALEVRLGEADTIIVLNFSLFICLSRAILRSSERFDFWWWVVTWRWLSWPKIRKAIKVHANKATLLVFHNPNELKKFLASVK
jgi:adenylate kinase family enzyme